MEKISSKKKLLIVGIVFAVALMLCLITLIPIFVKTQKALYVARNENFEYKKKEVFMSMRSFYGRDVAKRGGCSFGTNARREYVFSDAVLGEDITLSLDNKNTFRIENFPFERYERATQYKEGNATIDKVGELSDDAVSRVRICNDLGVVDTDIFNALLSLIENTKMANIATEVYLVVESSTTGQGQDSVLLLPFGKAYTENFEFKFLKNVEATVNELSEYVGKYEEFPLFQKTVFNNNYSDAFISGVLIDGKASEIYTHLSEFELKINI